MGKAGKADSFDLAPLLVGLPPLPERPGLELRKIAPSDDTDVTDLDEESQLRRVNFALEGLLAWQLSRMRNFPTTKNLSENCHVAQNAGTRELDEGQPVGGFLAPTSPHTASLRQPA